MKSADPAGSSKIYIIYIASIKWLITTTAKVKHRAKQEFSFVQTSIVSPFLLQMTIGFASDNMHSKMRFCFSLTVDSAGNFFVKWYSIFFSNSNKMKKMFNIKILTDEDKSSFQVYTLSKKSVSMLLWVGMCEYGLSYIGWATGMISLCRGWATCLLFK